MSIQRAEIDDYAEETGKPLAEADHFTDNDISASEFSTKPRKQYIELIAEVMRGLVSEIIVTEVPRLTRRTDEALEIIRLSKTTPLRYITTTDDMKYDLHTPRGRKAFREAVSDAEFESDQTSSRQHRRSNKLAEAGAVHGGQRAYGYEGAQYEELVTPDGEAINGRLLNPGRVGVVIVEHEAEIRREGTQRVIAGERPVDIVRDFNSRGITTAEGNKWRPSNFKRLIKRKRDVAFNEFPGKGTRVHKGKEYRATWDAIISKEDYELALAALRLQERKGSTDAVVGRSYLLTGKVHCTHANHGPMYGRPQVLHDGTYHRRYGCRAMNNYGEKIPGPGTFRGAEALEQWVTEAVLIALDSPAVQTTLAPQENRERITELVAQHSKQQLHAQQLVADYGAGLLSRDELIIAKDAAKQELEKTEKELERLQSYRTMLSIPAGETLREAFENASLSWQQQIIDLVVEKVIVKPQSARVIWRGHVFNPDDVEIVWKV